MTEQMPEDLTETEEADRLDVDRTEDEGDTASGVDRWKAVRAWRALVGGLGDAAFRDQRSSPEPGG